MNRQQLQQNLRQQAGQPGLSVMDESRKSLDLSGFGFRKLKQIGRGHYATVQLVEESDSGLYFVAKCVSLAPLSEHDQKSAQQEVLLLQALRHPLIVAYHSSFVVDATNTLVIVMEHCDGGDLRKCIRSKAESGEHFSEDEVMAWFAQISLALHYIHSERILHRDLKTSNVFLTEGSVIKLGDFGISRVLEGTSDAAVTMVGTPYYMSPEVCRNEPYSWKSDVWALGCVLYELCMLKHAFESESLMGLVYKIVQDRYEPIPSTYSQSLGDLVCELLAKPAESRPTTKELLAKPLVEAYARVCPGWPPADVAAFSEAPAKLSPETETESALQEPLPSCPQGGNACTARGLLCDVDGQESVLPSLPLQPQVRVLVLASRVRRRLVVEKLNWISTLAPFDERGEGGVPLTALCSALAALPLGLSHNEAVELVEAMDSRATEAGGEVEVQLASFGAKLVESEQRPEAQVIRAWARRLLEPVHSNVAAVFRSDDVQQLGTLQSHVFLTLLKELVPEVPEEHLDVLQLLADKSETGSIDYMSFVDAFAAPPPPPPLPTALGPESPLTPRDAGEEGEQTFFTCASQELAVAKVA